MMTALTIYFGGALVWAFACSFADARPTRWPTVDCYEIIGSALRWPLILAAALGATFALYFPEKRGE